MVSGVPKHIAILGSGITGLSAAFHAARNFPTARITVLERSTRVGGWVSSDSLDTAQDGRVVLEAGPRTLRPNSNAVLELIHLLGLTSQVITTPKTSAAVKNRFLCLPDTQPRIRALPSSIFGLLWTPPPLRRLLLSNILKEPFKGRNRPQGITDESFDGLLTRRFGAEFARVFGSAMVHGIYAADSRELSVRSAFPVIWKAEEMGWGSIVLGILRMDFFGGGPPTTATTASGYELGDVPKLMVGTSVFSFKDGMSTVTNALHAAAKEQGVEFMFGEQVKKLHVSTSEVKLTTNNRTLNPTHIISTLPLPKLANLLPLSNLPHLTSNKYTNVTVTNFVFPSFALNPDGSPSTHPIHPAGFGYLIPRPPSGYTSESDGVLGVVFDSCALSAQDVRAEGITKLTVMSGGPHISPNKNVLEPLAKQLGLYAGGLKLPKPLYQKTTHHDECIPTLGVGHLERMEDLRQALMEKDGWNSRLEIIGAGVGGVSVGDCVEAGRRAGSGWMRSDFGSKSAVR